MDYMEIKLRRNPASELSEIYEFKSALFENENTEVFVLFAKKLNLMFKSSRTLQANAKLQYLRTLLFVEAQH